MHSALTRSAVRREPCGICSAREAEEAIEAIGQPDYAEEVADCLLLIIDAARRGGMSFEALVDAAREKQEINARRDWPDVGEDDGIPVEHVRSDDD